MLTFILKQKQKNKQKPVGMFSLLPLPGAFLSSFLFPLKTRPQILTFLSKCICHFLDTDQVYLLPFQLISLSPVFSAGHLLFGSSGRRGGPPMDTLVFSQTKPPTLGAKKQLILRGRSVPPFVSGQV